MLGTSRGIILIIVALMTTHVLEAGSDSAKITLVQLTTRGTSPESTIERMPAFFGQAARFGSDLIVFPECGALTNKAQLDPK